MHEKFILMVFVPCLSTNVQLFISIKHFFVLQLIEKDAVSSFRSGKNEEMILKEFYDRNEKKMRRN